MYSAATQPSQGPPDSALIQARFDNFEVIVGRSEAMQRVLEQVETVAATNRNLAQMMGDKLFRSDLFYRLNVFPVTSPPLRDRPEDIPVLARHFTRKYALEMDRQVETIPPATMQALVNWPWPGNVRELENFIERSVILSRGSDLRVPLAELRADPREPCGGTLAAIEREYIIRVLSQTGGVVSAAASHLGLPRTTLNACVVVPCVVVHGCAGSRFPASLFDPRFGLPCARYISEEGSFKGEMNMLWTIFVVLLVLWLLGLVTSYTFGGFVHILLVLALVVLVIQLFQGRRAV
jgi:hypothetical protein